MDKYERRRLRLLRVRDEQFENNNAALAARIGKDASYVTRMFYEPGRARRKRIGEDSVEAVLRELGINLDAPENADITEPSSRKLQWIDDDEAALLSHFRATNAQGRGTILEAAELAPHVLFDEIANHQPKKGHS